MKLIDWVMRKVSPPQLEGDSRLAESYRNHLRVEEGLPPQRKAWFIDANGKRTTHDIDVHHDGTPNELIRIVIHIEEYEERKDTFTHTTIKMAI